SAQGRRRPVIEGPLMRVGSGQIWLGGIDGWRKDGARSLTLACRTADRNGPLRDTSVSGCVKQLGPGGCWGRRILVESRGTRERRLDAISRAILYRLRRVRPRWVVRLQERFPAP